MAYNRDNLHGFLDAVWQQYPGTNNSTYKAYKSFLLKTLEIYCLRNDIDFLDFSLEDIIKTIMAKRVSVNSARKYVSYMRQYGEWLLKENKTSITDWEVHPVNQNDVMSRLNSSIEHQTVQKNRYFTSYGQFNSCISSLFSRINIGTDDISRYYTDIAILYLAWLGFPTEQMLALTDEDVTHSGITDRPYEDETMQKFFLAYRDSLTHIRYYGQNGTRVRAWVKDGNKLLKGIDGVPNQYRLWKAGLRATDLAKRLPADHPHFNQKITIEDVKQSGLFCRMYKYRQDHPDASNKTILKEFERDMETNIDSSHTTGLNTLKEFQNWQQLL